MKPEEVRFHHIRDHPWRQKMCDKHGPVPYFHDCSFKTVKVAIPVVADELKPTRGAHE